MAKQDAQFFGQPYSVRPEVTKLLCWGVEELWIYVQAECVLFTYFVATTINTL